VGAKKGTFLKVSREGEKSQNNEQEFIMREKKTKYNFCSRKKDFVLGGGIFFKDRILQLANFQGGRIETLF
jgi:hypothetical protein